MKILRAKIMEIFEGMKILRDETFLTVIFCILSFFISMLIGIFILIGIFPPYGIKEPTKFILLNFVINSIIIGIALATDHFIEITYNKIVKKIVSFLLDMSFIVSIWFFSLMEATFMFLILKTLFGHS
jgi:hypothetical protein